MSDIILSFLLILVISFATGIPFGPVNLSVLNTSLTHNSRAGIRMALGSATAEVLLLSIAIYITSLFTVAQTQSPWIKVVAMVVFVGIGLFFYHKEKWAKESTEEAAPRKTRQFLAGIAVNILNPQIIPFWVITIAWLNSAGYADLTISTPWPEKLFLVSAVFFGKGTALCLYSLFSQVIKNKAQHIRPHLDRAIGIFLVGLGFFQGATAAWEYFL